MMDNFLRICAHRFSIENILVLSPVTNPYYSLVYTNYCEQVAQSIHGSRINSQRLAMRNRKKYAQVQQLISVKKSIKTLGRYDNPNQHYCSYLGQANFWRNIFSYVYVKLRHKIEIGVLKIFRSCAWGRDESKEKFLGS